MGLSWLLSWWRGKEKVPVRVEMFTRRGCHLCDDAWQVLQAEQERAGFTLTLHDVDSDPRWVAEYGESVPVVVVNGQVRFRGRVNLPLLRRLLHAEARRRP